MFTASVCIGGARASIVLDASTIIVAHTIADAGAGENGRKDLNRFYLPRLGRGGGQKLADMKYIGPSNEGMLTICLMLSMKITIYAMQNIFKKSIGVEA